MDEKQEVQVREICRALGLEIPEHYICFELVECLIYDILVQVRCRQQPMNCRLVVDTAGPWAANRPCGAGPLLQALSG